jgi:hypothetical protein
MRTLKKYTPTIQENAATALNQSEYSARFDSLLERDKAAKSQLK